MIIGKTFVQIFIGRMTITDKGVTNNRYGHESSSVYIPQFLWVFAYSLYRKNTISQDDNGKLL